MMAQPGAETVVEGASANVPVAAPSASASVPGVAAKSGASPVTPPLLTDATISLLRNLAEGADSEIVGRTRLQVSAVNALVQNQIAADQSEIRCALATIAGTINSPPAITLDAASVGAIATAVCKAFAAVIEKQVCELKQGLCAANDEIACLRKEIKDECDAREHEAQQLCELKQVLCDINNEIACIKKEIKDRSEACDRRFCDVGDGFSKHEADLSAKFEERAYQLKLEIFDAQQQDTQKLCELERDLLAVKEGIASFHGRITEQCEASERNSSAFRSEFTRLEESLAAKIDDHIRQREAKSGSKPDADAPLHSKTIKPGHK
jgi:hypothetical protein